MYEKMTLYFTESFMMAVIFGLLWGFVGGMERIVISVIFPALVLTASLLSPKPHKNINV